MSDLDRTHDPALRSWVPGADGHREFPVQNLPIGIFSPANGQPGIGVAIGDSILDVTSIAAIGLLSGEAKKAVSASGSSLNAMLALGSGPRKALRATLSALLAVGGPEDRIRPSMHAASACTMHLPCAIGDYTDFYVGIHHANNIGKQFRPDNPLLPNYKHIPIGYHGRASSVRPSGTPVRRPNGQTKAAAEAAPEFGPCKRLDFELELGVWIGEGNVLGEPVPIGRAAEHAAGFCLLNDWSARDMQAWEYQPLGPFLAKNFNSTVSPWIVTPEALAPFRIPQPRRPDGDPAPLPYLLDQADQQAGAFDLQLDVLLLTPGLREQGAAPHRLSTSNAKYMYWTIAQMIAHHSSGGCDLRPGDLLGTGTISGPDPASCGSMLEATLGGKEPITLPSGERRSFLEDGDEIVFRVRAEREGFVSIGFGECRAMIHPALELA